MDKSEDFKLFTKYVSLNVMSMLGLSCYILADTYFIANGIGEDGLAALNLAIPMYSFINGIGLMLGIGGATKFAIVKAMGRKKEGSIIFTNMIMSALLVAAFFILLGIFSSERIASLLGADEYTFYMTTSYIRIIMLFSPAFLINGIINCFVKNDSNPRLAMCAMISGSFLNIVLDYIFIFPLNLGMSGAALATGSAPVLGLLILSFHFIKRKNEFKLTKTKIRKYILKESIPLGIPALVTEVSAGAVIVVFNILILKISGNIGVAAYGIIANISLVVISIYTGIAQGMQPVLSESYGRMMKKRVNNILKYGIVTTVVLSVFVYTSLYLFSSEISSAFNKDNDPELLKIAMYGIRIYFTGVFGAGINIVLSSYFAAVEKKIPAQVVSVLRGFLLIIPMAVFLSYIANLTGIWLAFPVAESITAFISISYLKKMSKNIK